ncbi:leucyl aminopeptidase [Thiotrichales bacterium 19S3-7]|nr:leucyl aminopeptidase [Thiotrichales bacterium 19S3-7]MCF6801270.1 leucyl aminopeptidase [Thiotrichales bacterium 19S3-11]
MEYVVKSGNPEKQRTAALVLGVFEGRKLSHDGESVDKASNGALSKILRRGDIEGSLGQTLMLFNIEGTLADRVLLVGCGKEKDLDATKFRQIIKKMVNTLNETGAMDAVCYLTQLNIKGVENSFRVRHAIESTIETLYRFDQFKSKKKEIRRPLRKLTLTVPSRAELNVAEKALKEGKAIAEGVSFTKDLQNMPPNVCSPEYLKNQAETLSKSYQKLDLEVLDKAKMQQLNMGALLAVSDGSDFDPFLISLNYRGAKSNQKPVVLVGKGLTYDTGGLCLKPWTGMPAMKMDMSGGAAVMGIIKTVAELKLPINIIGVVAAVENAIDGKSFRPGDVLTSMSGQTIEVINTDAEGRLALCDALTYVEKYDPDVIIDIATLTGAMIVALGNDLTGVFGNHSPLINDLLNAGRQTGDVGWHMPLHEPYQAQLKSDIADMKNLGLGGAGSSVAGLFLKRFVKKSRWAHLDIAGSSMGDFSKAAATGRPVPMIMQYLLNRLGEQY